jgi:signal transduction protein with GAF and PtsI domain
MLDNEIKILRDYLKKGDAEIEFEERSIDDQIEKETTQFFSQYEGQEVDESLRNEFRKSIANIYRKKTRMKKAVLAEIASQISSIEGEYLAGSM